MEGPHPFPQHLELELEPQKLVVAVSVCAILRNLLHLRGVSRDIWGSKYNAHMSCGVSANFAGKACGFGFGWF